MKSVIFSCSVSSPQKIGVGVRSMNPNVAGRAILESGIEHIMGARLSRHARIVAPESSGAVMTFQADRKNYRPPDEFTVHGSMRRMADFAAIHADGAVFENEGSSLILVTFDAGLFPAGRLIDHTRTDAHAPR